MALAQASGLVDLEKELSCSICTDVLFQPLTLLDCLHTFCGADVKEWFSSQRNQDPYSPNPFTCPSCRASVRGTKQNATVNTLLEIFLQANPEKDKSSLDKEELRKSYTPGDDVLPKPKRRRNEADEQERRLINEAQELSLREVGVAGDNRSSSRDTRRRDRSRENRDRDGRSRREPNPSRNQHRASNVPPQQLEHQSSLRSLLSVSEIDSREIQEEIMQQIVEEGLLDGIDLNNIDVSQEDEISERIAQAYRRRLESRRTERRRHRATTEAQTMTVEPLRPTVPAREEERLSSRRPRDRTEVNSSNSRPPVSRPHLFDAANQTPARRAHRRSSSQDSTARPTSRGRPSTGLAATSNSTAARSATDLSERPSSSQAAVNPERRRRLSHNDRSITDPERQNIQEQWRNAGATPVVSSSNPTSPRTSNFPLPGSPQSQSPRIGVTTDPIPAVPSSRRGTDTSTRAPRPTNLRSSPHIGSDSDAQPSPTLPPPQRPVMFPEPNITCNRCGKGHIEYELHYNCSRCEAGHYNICLRCYRQGRGCLHWYGFGQAAKEHYERKAPASGYPPGHGQPHVLTGRRYKRLGSEATHVSTAPETRQIMTNHDPSKRLQSGVFCETCLSFANACYWKCDFCNDGAWGFCNSCTNQGRHCTHPLLPLTHKATTSSRSPQTLLSSDPSSSPADDPGSTPSSPTTLLSPVLTPKSASIIRGPATGLLALANTLFRPLTFTTACDICKYPIPPSHTRFHCPRCNAGDYDICTSCYHGLVASGRISTENGHQGWRRCPSGHRMMIVGFEDRDGGQRRIVQRDLVGGLALKDEDGGDSQATRTTGTNANVGVAPNWSWRDTDGSVKKSRTTHVGNANDVGVRFPPDGGIGLRIQARWGYFPQEGVKDELMFPRGSEIREAEDINGDWFWGVYAGTTGLFPGGYGRIL